MAIDSVPLPHKTPENFDVLLSLIIKEKVRKCLSAFTKHQLCWVRAYSVWSLEQDEISFCHSSNIVSRGVLWAEYGMEILFINKIQKILL